MIAISVVKNILYEGYYIMQAQIIFTLADHYLTQ